jgi:hypothetical protein
MKGDFSRLDFNRARRFSRVLMQQGRVTLDFDANEASAILLHQLRMLTRDLFGAAGGPADGSGFALTLDTAQDPARLLINAGHYYVAGILCEAEETYDYASQPWHTPLPPDASGAGGDPLLLWLDSLDPDLRFWVYLDVWERHVSWIEDDGIREPALGGADTATRAQVIWQVKALPWQEAWNRDELSDRCVAPLEGLIGIGSGRLAVRLDPGEQTDDPCIIAPDARYRGAESQLYRIEIHGGGAASIANFKWSRDNGSIAARWLGSEGDALIVSSTRGFRAGDWVELSHEGLELSGQPGELVRLTQVKGDRLTTEAAPTMVWDAAMRGACVRRWDQRGHDDLVLRDGAAPVIESNATEPQWIDIGDGLQLRFEPDGVYRTGDYWTIKASAATGGIEWPVEANGRAQALPAQGVQHYFAPLGILAIDNEQATVEACRRCLAVQAVDCPPAPPPPPPPPAPQPTGRGPSRSSTRPTRRGGRGGKHGTNG